MTYVPLAERPPADQRTFLVFYARVCLRESRSRRGRDPGFADTLLGWAQRARRQAAAIPAGPVQRDLFAGAR